MSDDDIALIRTIRDNLENAARTELELSEAVKALGAVWHILNWSGWKCRRGEIV